MKQGGSIANSGLTAGVELHTTVMPFILRGVTLLGIDSAMYPRPQRIEVWRRLATDLRPGDLAKIGHEIGLQDLPAAFDTLLKGAARGRSVVKIQ
jgi:NADPH2:quinone reductase